MLSPLPTQPRFQGIQVLKQSDIFTGHVSKTSEATDAQLLASVERITQHATPSSTSRATGDVNYRFGGGLFISLSYLANGIAVYLDSPAIKEAGGNYASRSHPHIYLTFDTVAASLTDSLKRVQQIVGQKLGRSENENNDHAEVTAEVVKTAKTMDQFTGFLYEK